MLDEARQRERTAYDLAFNKEFYDDDDDAAQEQYNSELMMNMMRERDHLANEKKRAAIELHMLEQEKQAE